MGALDPAGRRRAGGPSGEAVSDAIRSALSRAAIYRVLAVAFAYPAPGHADDVARAAASALPSAPAAARSALAALARTPASCETDALAEQYVALFDRQVACPPYEGAYGPPRMGGKAMELADIAGFYMAFGMTATGRQPDADDHIGAELEFMAALALREAWALGEGDADHARVAQHGQRAFLEDHLGRWGDAFAARVLEVRPTGFYASAARLLVAWLDAECGLLAITPDRLRGGRAVEDDAPLSCPMASE